MPCSGSYSAIAARGSIALTTMRLLRNSQPRHMRRAVECRGDRLAVAEMEIEPDIAGYLVIKLRRVRCIRQCRLADRRQRLDIDHDRFGRVLRRCDGLGDDCGNRLADMPHLVGGKRMVHRAQHRRAVAILHNLARRQRADPARRQIGRGINRQHARHRPRRCGVDAADKAMRIRAAHASPHRPGPAG